MGVKAVELLMDHQTGLMIGIQNNQLITQQINQGTTAHVPIDEKGLHLLKALLTQVE
jgi:6-phosphofructokinase